MNYMRTDRLGAASMDDQVETVDTDKTLKIATNPVVLSPHGRDSLHDAMNCMRCEQAGA
jgi:hypothetical protein